MKTLYLYHPDGRITIFMAKMGLKQIITSEGFVGGTKKNRTYGPEDCPDGFDQQFYQLIASKRDQGFTEETPTPEYRAQALQFYKQIAGEEERQRVLQTVTVTEQAPAAAWF